jgi:hypothetical protein
VTIAVIARELGVKALVNMSQMTVSRMSFWNTEAIYYATQMRGVSNAKAKRELNFQPRPLEWIVDTAMTHAG